MCLLTEKYLPSPDEPVDPKAFIKVPRTPHSKSQTARELLPLIREYERSQASVKNRMGDILQGNLTKQRTPTKSLIKHQDQARQNIRKFLEELTQDEENMLDIAWGTRKWRDQLDEMLSPSNDPVL